MRSLVSFAWQLRVWLLRQLFHIARSSEHLLLDQEPKRFLKPLSQGFLKSAHACNEKCQIQSKLVALPIEQPTRLVMRGRGHSRSGFQIPEYLLKLDDEIARS